MRASSSAVRLHHQPYLAPHKTTPPAAQPHPRHAPPSPPPERDLLICRRRRSPAAQQCVSIRQQAYASRGQQVSIRQHTSAYLRSVGVDRLQRSNRLLTHLHTSAYVSMSANISPAAQQWSADAPRRARASELAAASASSAAAHVRIRQHTSAYVSLRQHTLAHVSIHQHTSANTSARGLKVLARMLYIRMLTYAGSVLQVRGRLHAELTYADVC
jgi:hypothetical protein